MHWKILIFLLASVSALFSQQMEIGDVRKALAQAVQEALVASPGENRVIAITDREGHVLAVWDVSGAAPPNLTPEIVADAVSKAGAAAFLSSNQHAFTTRTAAFIVQNHFPPAVANRPNGPLVGVNFSSMAFSDTNKYKAPSAAGTFPSPPVPGADDLGSATPADAFRSVPFTSLLTLPAAVSNPGGVPLFKNGLLVGGIGVVGFADAAVTDFEITFQANVNERISLSGQAGFRPAAIYDGSRVFIDGIRLAYTVGAGSNATVADPAGYLAANGAAATFADIDGVAASSDDGPVDYSPRASPPAVVYPNPFGLTGTNGIPGQLRSAIRADPLAGLINGQARLTAAEVESILQLAAERSVITRAGIRLPRGQISRVWISVVNNPNADQVEPVVLGTYRTPDATIFSWDVAIQKARTALFFSRGLERNTGPPRAFSCRTIGFLAQDIYPPGIGRNPPGPFFGLQALFSLQGGTVPSEPINLNVPNGITIFPGGFPLYRNGILIGAIGVSGDGIEQDDIVAASGARDFLPPAGSRADGIVYQNARLPYAKFPRASTSF
jgi:uncharacterized protein GlcG (DUF336 family)